jgi:hypothetical protein
MTPMTDFALENAKLIMLFVLISTVIGLSHLNVNILAKLKSAGWRNRSDRA